MHDSKPLRLTAALLIASVRKWTGKRHNYRTSRTYSLSYNHRSYPASTQLPDHDHLGALLSDSRFCFLLICKRSISRCAPEQFSDDKYDCDYETHKVIVISGETGCGKTTQLPQYVLESEIESGRGAFCSIICTQPRRISAMAVAERVSTERGEPLGETVGYKVRLEGMKGKNANLLYCTSGILLRMLLSDRNLNGITHVFVDEIHERGMNEDFLLTVLKELLPRRCDLRLVLMSATLNAELFSSYFCGAPTFHFIFQ